MVAIFAVVAGGNVVVVGFNVVVVGGNVVVVGFLLMVVTVVVLCVAVLVVVIGLNVTRWSLQSSFLLLHRINHVPVSGGWKLSCELKRAW